MTYLRALIFFGLTAPAFASPSLDALVNAAEGFSAAIQQQLQVVRSNPTPARSAKSTIAYAKVKTTYFHALRAAMLELMSIATGKEARPPEVDKFAMAFSVAGEKQAIRAEYETKVFLERFSGNPAIEKARAVFENARKAEEEFHEDFDGVDFTLERQPALYLFANHFLRFFVCPQSEENRLTQLAIERPLGKFYLGDQDRLDPVATLHDRRRDP